MGTGGHRRRTQLTLVPTDRRVLSIVGVVILVVVALCAALLTRHSRLTSTAQPPTPPGPDASLSIGRSTTTPPTSQASARPITCAGPTGGPSTDHVPSAICIPAIGVDATIVQLGLNHDGTVQVPPLSRVGDAGWYKYSATPGGVGPTVILGHVDSAQYGLGVFFRLGQLHGGDRIVVSRTDGNVATFRVDRVVEVPKKRFPTQAVYGPTSGPALRLVTCGGRFDSTTGNYEDNIIVYAGLQSIGPT